RPPAGRNGKHGRRDARPTFYAFFFFIFRPAFANCSGVSTLPRSRLRLARADLSSLSAAASFVFCSGVSFVAAAMSALASFPFLPLERALLRACFWALC